MPSAVFDYAILEQTAHRPWPMPASPWVMTQSWHDLLFAHWPIDAATLASNLPPALELDRFDGKAWLGIVPFHMTNVAPRAVPALPWVSAFPELNVRTYVRVGGKPGVYFFSLDAGNALAVAVARGLFNLPYHQASMDVASVGDTIRYRSRRAEDAGPSAWFAADYQPASPVTDRVPRHARTFFDRTLLPVHRRQRRRAAARGHPPSTVAAAGRDRDDPLQHDGGGQRPRVAGPAAALALRETPGRRSMAAGTGSRGGSMSDETRRPRSGTTDEVGDEGGGTGDVEVDRHTVTQGSEATSTVDSETTETIERHRDETGEGRRSP